MSEKREIAGEFFQRKLTLDRESADDDTRSIDASISSEYPVERWFGTEVLRHTADAVNLERAGDNGLPLLFSHDSNTLIGRARNVRLKKGKLRARLDFSENSEKGREVWADIRDGFLTDISLGYEINEVAERDEIVEVTRFTPLEASIVAVPADPSVGINRSKTEGKKPMSEIENDTGQERGAGTVADFKAATEKASKQGAVDGIKQERKRVESIDLAFARFLDKPGVTELRNACVSAGTSAEEAQRELLDHLAGDPQPVATERQQSQGAHGQRIEMVRDAGEKWSEGITQALEIRAGLVKDREEVRKARAENEFVGMTLGDMARHYLVQQRADLSGLSRQQIAGQAFIRAGMHGTSDFANVLENIANKSMMVGYDEAPETWSTWCRTGNLSDFKAASRVNISTFSDLETVAESAEYKEGHISDLKESIQLLTKGKTFTISRQAIINDDMDAMTRLPSAMGRAAARAVGDLAYNVITSNPTLNQDGQALFVAGHNNLAAAGGAISETTLDEGRVAMATQTAPAPAPGETGATLNIPPSYLLVPYAINMVATKTVRSVTAPDTTGDLVPNTFYNSLIVVPEARLDADSATAWYLAASPMAVDTVEVAFLDGNDAPFMESQDGFKQDGVTYKVRIDCAAAALDFRGLYKNPGA